jgi:signal transduction histidine kinase
MRISRLKRFLSWLGPHDYNYSLIFAWIFIFLWAQARPFITTGGTNRDRLRFGLEVSLVVSSITLIIVLYLFICMKLRRNKTASLSRYSLEVIGASTLSTFMAYVYNESIIPWTNRPKYLGPDDKPIIFIVRIIFCFLFIAATHQLQKSLKLRLQDAEATNQALLNEYKVLIEADEEIRGQASRYLHDRVQSEIMLASFQLKKRVDEIGFSSDEEIRKSISQLEKIRSVDLKLVSQLLTPNIEAEGLPGAIESLCEQYSSNIKLGFDFDSTLDQLSSEQSLGVFRIVEQALINAITHGPATKVVIKVRANSLGGFFVEIADNGPGADAITPGTGSVIIDAWVSILKGKKEISTNTGQGYTLLVRFPVTN